MKNDTRENLGLPADAPEGTVCCGPLRREPSEPSGMWFLGSLFLGRDGDPQQSVYDLKHRVEYVAERLAEALDQACDDLRRGGQENQMHHGLLTLKRYHRWQATGEW